MVRIRSRLFQGLGSACKCGSAVLNCLHICLFFPSEQGTSLSAERVGAPPEIVDRSFQTRVVGRWLNVILDLNGILCVSKERRHMPKDQVYNGISYPHSAVVPAAVGPKAVFVRPHCHEFLRDLCLVAYVTIWSSMALPTTKTICEYLFWGLKAPLHILG